LIQDRRVVGSVILPLRDEDPDGAAEPILSRLREAVGQSCPDAVVVDLGLSIHRGVELLRAITVICPDAEIVARVESRGPESRFFSLRPRGRGLSLHPLAAESMGRIRRFMRRAARAPDFSNRLEPAEEPIA
jgi:hypothetical protein